MVDFKPFDTPVWGEVAAKDGLTGMVFAAGQTYGADGDKIVLPKRDIFLQGLGMISDTKPAGCALVPDAQDGGLPMYGPGSIDFASKKGWEYGYRKAPKRLFRGDKITGQGSSTNVNEGSVVGADLVFDKPVLPWTLTELAKLAEAVYTDFITITSTSDVLYNSGSVQLDVALSNDNKWLDPKRTYLFVKTIPVIGGATFGGIMSWTKLGGKWTGRQPGIPISSLSAVNFDPGHGTTPLQPIPFDGDSLPYVGMTAATAGAVKVAAMFFDMGLIKK